MMVKPETKRKYILPSGGVPKLSQQMHWNIWTWENSLFIATKISVWKACLRMKEIELELVTSIDMLETVEKGIKGGIFQPIHWYTKTNSKYTKDQ